MTLACVSVRTCVLGVLCPVVGRGRRVGARGGGEAGLGAGATKTPLLSTLCIKSA